MNVLISSTTNWNHGDDFIRWGVESLLDEVLPPHNRILYDRNPDNFRRGEWLGNHFFGSIPPFIDLVVLAGTPSFFGGPVSPIYEFLAANPKVPMMCIGMGWGRPDIEDFVGPVKREVLQRDNVLIITRQEGLAVQLNELLGMEKATALPCPGMFCTGKLSRKDQNTAIVAQAPGGGRHDIGDDVYDKLQVYTGVLDAEHVRYLCVYKEDFFWYEKLGYAPFFSYSPEAFLQELSRYPQVLSTRLHGAIAALAGGASWAYVFCGDDNYRILEAAKMFQPVLTVVTPTQVIRRGSESWKIFSDKAWADYVERISVFWKDVLKEVWRETKW